MKKGPIILLIAGIALLFGLIFAPKQPETVAVEDAAQDHQHEGASAEGAQNPSADAEIDSVLAQMQRGSLPPMQGVLKIRSIAEAHPNNVKAQFTLGLMSLQTGQFVKAIERFDQVIALRPNYIEAYRLRGRAQLAASDTNAAAASFEKALSLADKNTVSEIEQELIELKLNTKF